VREREREREGDTQTDRQTDGQPDRQTASQTASQPDRQTDSQTDSQPASEPDRQVRIFAQACGPPQNCPSGAGPYLVENTFPIRWATMAPNCKTPSDKYVKSEGGVAKIDPMESPDPAMCPNACVQKSLGFLDATLVPLRPQIKSRA